MKKDGGVLKNWQLHILSEAYQEKYAEYCEGPVRILTATIVEDPTGRWQPGYHMKSSLVIRTEDGIVETLNTMYTLEGPEGDPTFGNKDIGDAVLAIFY